MQQSGQLQRGFTAKSARIGYPKKSESYLSHVLGLKEYQKKKSWSIEESCSNLNSQEN